MEKIDNFYKKINGSYFGFLGLAVSLICINISQMLFMTVDPTFNMFTNWLSDLGSGAYGYIYNIGMIISSILFIFFFIYLIRYMQIKGGNKKITSIALIFALISEIGGILIGIFPLEQPGILTWEHYIAAQIFFQGQIFFWMILGIFEHLNPEIPRILEFISFITAIIYIIFEILAHIILFSGQTQYWDRFPEWLGAFSMLAAIIIHGVYTLKTKIQ